MIPARIQDAVRLAVRICPDTTDWLVAKKQIMRGMSPSDRKNFTTRDPYSKKHHPHNAFELEIIELWRSLTGNTLAIDPAKSLAP